MNSASAAPAAIHLDRVTKRFSAEVTAVDAIDLDVRPGEFFSLLGPSGCGKTTTLRMIAGFEEPDEGVIVVGGRDLTHVPVHRRDMGMVFQSYALFPHRTVAENVGFGLRMRGVGKREIAERVREALGQVALSGYDERRPGQLSGGQQQRVALARAIVIRPTVLLCDEPLGALDRKLRQAMQLELKALQRRLGVTLVFVTHDQEEALAMSDRIGIMNAGRLEQVGTPADIYDRPASRFVASFIGEINLLDGHMTGGRFAHPDGRALPSPAAPDGPATLAIRPERVALAEPGRGCLDGTVSDASFLGDQIVYAVAVEGGTTVLAKERNTGAGGLRAAGARRSIGRRTRPCSSGTLMARLGIAVIGQAPRRFVEDTFRAALPAGTTTVLRGCLDGLSDDEVDALTPRDGADTLYTRLRGERDVKISKAEVVRRAPDTLARLRADGADAVVFACTGEFPPMAGEAGTVFPSRVLAGLAAGLLPSGRLGLLVPAPEQIEKLSAKWARDGVTIVAEALLPSADEQEARTAGERLRARGVDLVAMDCMSYTPDTKAAIRAAAGVPAILAVTATAKVLQELLS